MPGYTGSAVSVVAVTELRYQDGGSNKFYRTYVGDDWVVFNWGAIGASGQFTRVLALNTSDAFAQASKKLNEKYAKGYQSAGIASVRIPKTLADSVRLGNPASQRQMAFVCDQPLSLARSKSNHPQNQGAALSASEKQRAEKLRADLLKMAAKLGASTETITGAGSEMSMREKLDAALAKAKENLT